MGSVRGSGVRHDEGLARCGTASRITKFPHVGSKAPTVKGLWRESHQEKTELAFGQLEGLPSAPGIYCRFQAVPSVSKSLISASELFVVPARRTSPPTFRAPPPRVKLGNLAQPPADLPKGKPLSGPISLWHVNSQIYSGGST